MEEDKRRETVRDAEQDFLAEISNNQFGGRTEEQDFLESISPSSPKEDIQINVGERVKQVRKDRDLTLQDISQRTDLEVAFLEQIENGSVAPPLGTVIKLAKALDLKMGYFISGDEDRPFTIVRKNDGKVVSRYSSKKGKYYGYGYESLAPHKKDRHMEPFLVSLEPSESDEERSAHDGQEFIYVLEGAMEVRLGEEVYVLDPGDSIYYDSTVPHLVKNHGKDVTRILAVLYSEG
ncbi:MAG: cupin domain-containing protein [Deltaproteobacteria bacterium]|nr:cupin domain-containing protein [Deltaproteobacteria bacterium]